MRSVRIPDELDERLLRAAERTGETASDFIREAVAERATRVLGTQTRAALADVIGVAHGGASDTAAATGTEFRRRLRSTRAT